MSTRENIRLIARTPLLFFFKIFFQKCFQRLSVDDKFWRYLAELKIFQLNSTEREISTAHKK